MAVVVLLMGKANPARLTEAGRLSSVPAHVGHQQQGRTEALPALSAAQHPLVSPGVALQLLCSLEPLPALQAPDLIRLRLLVAPAACVLFVLLKVPLTEELPETRHAVDALGFALVLVVELGQAEVAAASHAGVGQQAEVREGVA